MKKPIAFLTFAISLLLATPSWACGTWGHASSGGLGSATLTLGVLLAIGLAGIVAVAWRLSE